MFNPMIQRLMAGAACAFAGAALLIAAPIHAQPAYDDNGYDNQSTVGGIVVRPPHRPDWDSDTRSFVDRAYSSRVIDISDLDLNTDWGARELRARVVRAAYTVCWRLADAYGSDADENRDCRQRAINHALASVPAAEMFRSGDDDYDSNY
jgi:UrcA family protein